MIRTKHNVSNIDTRLLLEIFWFEKRLILTACMVTLILGLALYFSKTPEPRTTFTITISDTTKFQNESVLDFFSLKAYFSSENIFEELAEEINTLNAEQLQKIKNSIENNSVAGNQKVDNELTVIISEKHNAITVNSVDEVTINTFHKYLSSVISYERKRISSIFEKSLIDAEKQLLAIEGAQELNFKNIVENKALISKIIELENDLKILRHKAFVLNQGNAVKKQNFLVYTLILFVIGTLLGANLAIGLNFFFPARRQFRENTDKTVCV